MANIIMIMRNANLRTVKGNFGFLCTRFVENELNAILVHKTWSFTYILLENIIKSCKLSYDHTTLSRRAAMLVEGRVKIISFTEFAKKDTFAATIEVSNRCGKTELYIVSAYFFSDIVEAIHSFKVWIYQLKVSNLNNTVTQIVMHLLITPIFHFRWEFLSLYVCFSGNNFEIPVLINMLKNELIILLKQFSFHQETNTVKTILLLTKNLYAIDVLAVVQLWDESLVIL